MSNINVIRDYIAFTSLFPYKFFQCQQVLVDSEQKLIFSVFLTNSLSLFQYQQAEKYISLHFTLKFQIVELNQMKFELT